jgi:tRNA (guanine-N7-)-methyltransferase
MTSLELFAWQLSWPVDWAQVYGRTAPLLVEIGFGGGHFLVELARARFEAAGLLQPRSPSANVLGVEISLPGIRRGLKKLAGAGVSNGRVVQCSADYLLWACCSPQSISEVYLNFPDPWPKASQQNRRLINDTFLELLATRMVPDGRLHIATDDPNYAAAIAAALERAPSFSNGLPTPFVTQDETRPRTKYEQIALDDGRTCHYFHWQRNHQPAPRPFPIPQEHPMPHVILQSPLTLAEIKARFTPQERTQGDRHVRLPMMFQATAEKLLLVEAYIHEEPVSQHVGLLIRQRQSGEYQIGLATIGFPRPTIGVHLAIGTLVDWLMGLDEGTAVQHHNLITSHNWTEQHKK